MRNAFSQLKIPKSEPSYSLRDLFQLYDFGFALFRNAKQHFVSSKYNYIRYTHLTR